MSLYLSLHIPIAAGSPLPTTSPVPVPSIPALDRDPETTGYLPISVTENSKLQAPPRTVVT